jgi:DNA-binding MarR family transcriptional regulator
MRGVDRQRPIGWWVKRLDELLEQGLDDVVAVEGLTRRHWQALDSLAGGPADRAQLAAALASFAPPGEVDDVVAGLVARGWVGETGGVLAPTADGRAAHARLAGAVAGFRRRVTEGMPREEYAQTVAGLARMVGNLERGSGGQPRG